MLGLIFAAPFLLFLVVFALSNTSPVQLGLWPTDLVLNVPLSIAVLGAGAVFFLLGAIVVSVSSLGQRRRARRAEARVRALEREIQALRPRPVIMPGSSLQTIDG
jgi:uncharacterized integral membrane protein